MSVCIKPLGCLSSNTQGNAVLVLNMIVPCSNFSEGFKKNFVKLWNSACYRVCADGGSNFIFDLMKEYEGIDSNKPLFPHLISGDFDSITKETKTFFENCDQGIDITETPDQNATDFTKAVQLINLNNEKFKLGINQIIAVGNVHHRLDHVMANINTLAMAKRDDLWLCYIVPNSYSCILNKGKTEIIVDTGHEGDWCGLIPISGEVVITTTGLKWNMKEQTMRFGDIISTSNKLDGSGIVTVKCNIPVLWVMAQNKLF